MNAAAPLSCKVSIAFFTAPVLYKTGIHQNTLLLECKRKGVHLNLEAWNNFLSNQNMK